MVGQVDDGPAEVPLVFAADIDDLHIYAEVVGLPLRIATILHHHDVVGIIPVSQIFPVEIALVSRDGHARRILEGNGGAEIAALDRVLFQGVLVALPIDACIQLQGVGLVPAGEIGLGAIIGADNAYALAPVDTAEPPAPILAERKFVTERIARRRAEIIRHDHALGIGRGLAVVFGGVRIHGKRLEVALGLVIEPDGGVVAIEQIPVAVFRGKQPRRGGFHLLAVIVRGGRVVKLVQ